MNSISELSPWWAALVVVGVPLIIVGAAELDERLRQRQSPLRTAARTLRYWALPFFAAHALLTLVLAVDSDSIWARITGTAIVISVAVAAVQLLRVIMGDLARRPVGPGDRPIPHVVLAMPRIGVYLVAGWLVIGTVWGVDLTAALTALGVTSLVISFALQDTLSGLAAGVLLLSDQPFKPGDWISTGDTEGQVVDISWRTSRIRNRAGDLVIIPNSELAGGRIVNFTSPDPVHAVNVTLQVAYSNPPTLAKAMLLDAAAHTPGVLLEPAPSVRVTVIDDPLMTYEVKMWVDDYAIVPRVSGDFGALVWYHSYRHEVPLPSPAHDLYVYDGVEAGKEGIPTLADIRRSLLVSPLLSSLSEEDLDQLSGASQPVRFAEGELMVSSRDTSNEMVVIVAGTARLNLDSAGDDSTMLGELGVGEVVWLLPEPLGEGRNLSASAISDCEVVLVASDIAGDVASRNPEIASALNRLATMRRRRAARHIAQVEPEGSDLTAERPS